MIAGAIFRGWEFADGPGECLGPDDAELLDLVARRKK
jgi:hypothetical protein